MATTMKFLQFAFLLLIVLCLSSFVAGTDKVEGQTYTIKCREPQEDAKGISLLTRFEVQREVLYYFFNNSQLTEHEDYSGRIKVNYVSKTLIVEILNLQKTDTGAYWCICRKLKTCEMKESGDFLRVLEKESTVNSAASKSVSKSGGINDLLIPVTALTACSVLFFLLLVLGVWLVPKMRRRNTTEEEKRGSNGVYEVMTVNQRNEFR